MIASDPRRNVVAVLDACVLWPASLRDTLLRLAETPRLYVPKSSDRIWAEVTTNLANRRGLNSRLSRDRHVLAAAVKCGAKTIVTSNLKDFPTSSQSKWGIEVRHPDEFLGALWDLDPQAVASRLRDQAETIGRTLPELLITLSVGVQGFAARVA